MNSVVVLSLALIHQSKERKLKHTCFKLEGEDGVGAVVLDYNHEVDHVRHYSNSMKTFAPVKTYAKSTYRIFHTICPGSIKLPWNS